MGKKKHLAIAAYRCEIAGIPHDGFIDIQVKYFEFEDESQIEPALIAEPSHSYLNVAGEKVDWLYSGLLIIHNYDEPEHGKELCGCHIGAAEITKLSSPPVSIENEKRSLAIKAESEWLLSLTPKIKAQFLASLSFNLTIAGRDSYQLKTTGLDDPEQLRYINEIQHRISQTLLRVLDGTSHKDFEKAIAESLIGEENINQRGYSWAWQRAKTQIQSNKTKEIQNKDSKLISTVYLLSHEHHIAPDTENAKLLGVYATHTEAQQKIDSIYKHLPGFNQADGEFTIDCYTIGKDEWAEGFGSR